MNSVLHDLRYAIRTLWRAPGFVLVVVLALAVGIGLNTAVFSLVNAALFRPLPAPNADQLVFLQRQSPQSFGQITLSYPDYREYRECRDLFADLIAFSILPVAVGQGDAAATRMGQIVTANYFEMLGTPAHLGRLLTEADDEAPGGHPVTVLSHRYWRLACQGDPNAVGQTLLIAARPFTIIGVAPPGFSGAMSAVAPDLWIPMPMLSLVRPEMTGALEQRNSNWVQVLGRLRPDVSFDQAAARLDVIAPRVIARHDSPEDYGRLVLVPATGAFPLTPGMRRMAVSISLLVLAMVGLVLLIACANVANVLLARASARRREIGVRLALGASRWRIVRQLLTESLLLALAGGGAGVLLATWSLEAALRLLPELPMNISPQLDLRPDARVLAFTLAVSILTGIIFGLLPALQATRLNVAPTLKDGAGWGGGLGRPSNRLRSTLVVSQVAVSCVLLVSAGLFLRSLHHLQDIDLGFEHRDVLALVLDLGGHHYESAARADLVSELLDRVSRLPGVKSASMEDCPALGPVMLTRGYWLPDVTGVPPNDAFFELDSSTVTAGHFANLSISLLRGREFTPDDLTGAQGVAVVNQALVDRYWPNQEPLGKRISTHGPGGPFLEVVGVVATIKYRLPGEPPRPYVYLPMTRRYEVTSCVLLARTSNDPLQHLPAVRRIMRDLDPDLAPASTGPLTQLISYVMLPAKLAAGLFSLFGLLALGLASTGLYAVMAYAVARRTHEIGVRVALGAERRTVIRLVLKRCLGLASAGTLIGLMVATLVTRVLTSMLHDTSPLDPLTFAGVPLLLLAVALLAGYVPARRAARVDPMVALRCE